MAQWLKYGCRLVDAGGLKNYLDILDHYIEASQYFTKIRIRSSDKAQAQCVSLSVFKCVFMQFVCVCVHRNK